MVSAPPVQGESTACNCSTSPSITSAAIDRSRFGDYQIYPEEPTVGTEQYEAKIYNSWDPNWRGFVGTTFVLMLEEFPHLIPHETQDYMLESLFNTTIGDSYRVGGVDTDNLYPAYSNPSIMRAFVSGWVGRRANDSNMTIAGETYAQEVIDLFKRDNTLSEFNSGTYAGVSLFALTLWAKYQPQDSVMGQYGGEMIKHTWNSLGELYNANLKNVAGPWDRSYGYDMNKYLSILALQMWTLVGKENAPMNAKVCRASLVKSSKAKLTDIHSRTPWAIRMTSPFPHSSQSWLHSTTRSSLTPPSPPLRRSQAPTASILPPSRLLLTHTHATSPPG